MRIRYRWFILLILLCVFLASWMILEIINKSAIVQDFPIYDNAENVKINHIVREYPWERQNISFQTSDNPKKILTYYHQLLVAKGWRLTEDRDGIASFISGGCPFISVEIVMSEHDEKTAVDITLDQQPCQ